MENHEIIAKTFDTLTSISAGRGELNPEQQTKYSNKVRDYSTFLPRVRFVRMKQNKMDLDKMHISEPVTQSVDQNTTFANLAQGKFNTLSLVAQKIVMAWDVTTEHLRNNIMREQQEENLLDALTRRQSTDAELLAIQGDTTIVANTAEGRLLRRLDGWDKLTVNSHQVDAKGKSISMNLFNNMYRRMPPQFKKLPGLAWVLSDVIGNDWMNYLSERISGLGDSAVGGKIAAPMGRELLMVSLIPSDKPLTVTTGTPATITGTAAGPFSITTGTNDVFEIDVNNIGEISITIPQGVLDSTVVIATINAQFVANSFPATAEDDGFGKIRITTDASGLSQEIDIGNGTANATLGFATDPAAVTGTDVGASGTLNEGSFIWLTDPQNFVFGLVDGTRMFSQFNPNFDRTEIRVFNEVAVGIDDNDAVVKGVNVRRKDLS